MNTSPLAGKTPPQSMLADLNVLLEAYHDRPDPSQPVAFGTSGHRGTSLNGSFTEIHIWAITQAVCDYRRQTGIDGPLFMGMDTHALSAPAHRSALEVLAANDVETYIHHDGQVTPTPVVSFSILEFNSRHNARADGIVITPSHNPPEDGGFKYNPPHGGPAGAEVTAWIEQRANALIQDKPAEIKKIPYERASRLSCVRAWDYMTPYLTALPQVVDMDLIAHSGLRLCADALGGSAGPFWEPLAAMYKLQLSAVNTARDRHFSFMTLDRDGKIRMDCSSPWAMAGLLAHKDEYDLCFGNDPDADRHGIVTPAGLMNPNHYLAACVDYLFTHRSGWKPEAGVGKTTVTSAMLDRTAVGLKRKILETPVGFKWFVEPLLNGVCAFGGEESAGASFLRMNGRPWSTDKDGLILNLLAAEMTAKTGRTPDRLYAGLTERYGMSYYERQDVPAGKTQLQKLKKITAAELKASSLAGDAVDGIFTRAPGNNEPLGGIKACTRNGWFAARPSGTEDIYKIYAESFVSQEHLDTLMHEAEKLVQATFV